MNKIYGKRWILIVAIMSLLMLALIGKLYGLTITKGKYYRDLADTKRLKEVEITAPRGNIYDRNGVLLAGTRSSFAVQGFKDDLLRLDKPERNRVLLKMIHLVERDGCEYMDTFPITLQTFVYENTERYFTAKESPRAYVERTLREKGLLGEWLKLVYSERGSMRVSVAARALTALSLKGSPLPIHADPDKDFAIGYLPGKLYDEWKKDGKLDASGSPLDLLVRYVSKDENLISQVMNHPAARILAYEVLKNHKLTGDVKLEPFVYTYEQDWIQNKAALHRRFPTITEKTTPKQDFTTIVREAALDQFLTSTAVDEDNKFIIPAEELINALNALGIESNLSYEIRKDAKTVEIIYEKEEQTQELPLDRLKRLALQNNLIDELIVNDKIKYIAQQAMFHKGIYPRISIDDWTYGQKQDQADFIDRYGLKGKDAKQAFGELRKVYRIDHATSDLEALGIMNITSRVMNQGNYAYAPVNLCYELSPSTVARIEENIPSRTGLVISAEPIRYYPFGESACHILGYIGKISTDEEIKKYIEQNHYLPDELIGKTGVEESFEDTLHGVSGKQIVMIDSFGNRTDTLQRTEPKAGNNLYLTIDIKLQLESEKALKKTILSLRNGKRYHSAWGDFGMNYSPYTDCGATVSTDPQTGELLALASFPAYDPNLFVTGISYSDWDALMPSDDKDMLAPRPLINVATQTAVQPGSVFKPVTALTALEKGLTPSDKITCSGYMEIGDREFECLIWGEDRQTHGTINVEQALEYSCNYFFYVLALGEDPKGNPQPGIKVTVDDIHKTADAFGLGKRTGLEINIPAETAGNIPSTKGKLELSKAILASALEEKLPKYKKPGLFKSKEDYRRDIETIVAWMDHGSEMSRDTILAELERMGYYAEKPLADEYEGLGDIIKYSYLNQADWTSADSLNMVIGQGQNAYTPIEINRYCATIANGGTRYQTTLLKEIRSHDDKTVVFTKKPEGVPLKLKNPQNIDTVRKGMKLAAAYGAPGMAFDGINLTVGSKTGTAERAGIHPVSKKPFNAYAWYMAFAPFDNPKICTVSFLSQAGSSSNAVPMTRDIMCSYLKISPSQKEDTSAYDDLDETPEQEQENDGAATPDQNGAENANGAQNDNAPQNGAQTGPEESETEEDGE